MASATGPLDPGPAALQPRRWRLNAPPPLPRPAAAADPPAVLVLDRRDALPTDLSAALLRSLDPQERQRHHSLRRPADRERFLLGRGGLRLLLGSWLGLPAAGVPLAIGPHGKPHCPGGPPFNVSHSGDLILLAVHSHRPVGVDVEQDRPELDWRPIATRMLPPQQLARLLSLPGPQQPDGFLREWCRLEARLKALGTGLAGPGSAAAEHPDPDLWDLALPPGYRGAVALAAPVPLRDRPADAAAPH